MRTKNRATSTGSEWRLSVTWLDLGGQPVARPAARRARLSWALPGGHVVELEANAKRVLEAVGASLARIFALHEDLPLPAKIRVDTSEIAAVMKMAWRHVHVVLDAPAPPTADERAPAAPCLH